MSTTEYMKNLMKDRNIASITPTSQAGVKEICDKMDLSEKVVIVEYGPATGVFTHYLLEHMTADSELIAIERNKNFARYLQENTNSDRLKIHHDSAENVVDLIEQHGFDSVDYVVSGIPFSRMSEYMKRNIVKKTSEIIRPGGKFFLYQPFFQKDEHLKEHLERYFPTLEDKIFYRNVPPLRIWEAVK